MHMKSTRPVGTIVLVGMWLGGFSACTSVLLNTPVTKNAEGWVVTLSQVKEGPNEYVGEVSTVAAGSNEKLIWTILTVKSELPQEETFSYDSCYLDGKEKSQRPAVVDRNAVEVRQAADRAEPFNPGQDRTRLLVYMYPEDVRPTAMKCGKIVLPIPAKR
jgi:hypothetical protein